MILSDNGLNFLKEREGYKESAYLDSAGVWTIGYGTTYIGERKVVSSDITDRIQATEWLLADIQSTEDFINDVVNVKLNQNEFDALVSLVYNIGMGGFHGSTLLRFLNKGSGIFADLFLRWNKITVKGKKVVSQGLLNRRKLEYELFIKD